MPIHTHDLPDGQTGEGRVRESAADLPVIGRHDVVVAGGGTAGLVAAIAAARGGADVLVVEYHGFLGGNVTGGYMSKPQGPLDFGIRRELYGRVREAGGASGHYSPPHRDGWAPRWWSSTDVEQVKLEAADMIRESGADVLFYTLVADVLVEDDAVVGLVVENKDGRGAVLADVVVDATGDGDVAARAGVPFKESPADERQPMTTMFKMGDVDLVTLARYVRDHPDDFEFSNVPEASGETLVPEDLRFELFTEGFFDLVAKARAAGATVPRASFNLKTARGTHEVFVNATRIMEGDGTDADELSAGVLEGYDQVRRYADFLRAYVPGFDDAYVSGIAPFFGVRESRRIDGEATLTWADIAAGRDFEDSIGVGECILDIHPPDEDAVGFRPVTAHGIPYGCLVPRGVDGLLVGGRCISVDHEAHGSTRLIPTAMLTGEVAGWAAALSAEKGVHPRDLPVDRLRERLSEEGFVLAVDDAVGGLAVSPAEVTDR